MIWFLYLILLTYDLKIWNILPINNLKQLCHMKKLKIRIICCNIFHRQILFFTHRLCMLLELSNDLSMILLCMCICKCICLCVYYIYVYEYVQLFEHECTCKWTWYYFILWNWSNFLGIVSAYSSWVYGEICGMYLHSASNIDWFFDSWRCHFKTFTCPSFINIFIMSKNTIISNWQDQRSKYSSIM